MKVLFKRSWFNPKGYRLRVQGKGTVHEVPEEWRHLLPSTAEVVEEKAPVLPLIGSKEPETFSEMNKMQELRRDTVEAIAEDTHKSLEASKKAQAKRNRQAGAAKARAAKTTQEEERNVEMA